MRSLRPVGFASLFFSLLLVAYLTLRSGGAGKTVDADAGPPPVVTLGAPPPANVGSDVRAARRHVETQNCLAACASEAQVCEMTSDDKAPCASARSACEAKCQ